MKTEHILIMRFSALGDVAMTVPVVSALAHQYPHVRITVLSKPFARELFEGLAPNVGFMEADLNNEYKGIKGLNALYRRLVAKNFTAIADFHNVLRSNYLRTRFRLWNYKVAHIDKHRKGKRELVADTGKKLRQQPTAFQNYADVLAKLGYPITLKFKGFFSEGKGNLRQLPAEINEKKPFQQWIGIAPFAAHPTKVYPLKLMMETIRIFITRHPSARIFLFGKGEAETEAIAQICASQKRCLNASALLTGLRQELTLMSHLDVMLSMDSANMHLASLVNVPVVSIWGATHPYAGFMGWHQHMSYAVQTDLACRPCSIFGNTPCKRGDLACLKNISPEMIVQRLELLLHKQ